MATDRRPAGGGVRHAQQFDNEMMMLIVNNTIKCLIITLLIASIFELFIYLIMSSGIALTRKLKAFRCLWLSVSDKIVTKILIYLLYLVMI